MFGFFRKKKKKEDEGLHYDPSNISIRDIRKGWLLDYDSQEWVAKEEYEYDWGNENLSYEFMLESDQGNTLFLSLEDDDGLQCVLSEKVKFNRLPNVEQIAEEIEKNGRPPRKVEYNNITFYRESETPGFFRNIKDENATEFIVWEYWDDTEKQVLNIEQWDDNDFEVSVGKVVRETAFSNFLPK